jgi:hypothetical protein
MPRAPPVETTLALLSMAGTSVTGYGWRSRKQTVTA